MTTTTSTTSWSTSFAAATVEAMRAYDAVVPIMFGPWADVLLDEVGVRAGERVLDVATGPGTVARPAAQRVGRAGEVTACDTSPAMLAVARSKPDLVDAAPIVYVECPADALDVADAMFDVVLCQQGLQFFADRRAALCEMRRALVPGGRIGVSVWCGIEACPPFEALSVALGEVLGPDARTAYRRGPWGLGDPAEVTALLAHAGFVDVCIERRTLPICFEGGPAQLLATLPTTVVASEVSSLDDAGREHLVAATTSALAGSLSGGAVRSDMAAHLVRATA